MLRVRASSVHETLSVAGRIDVPTQRHRITPAPVQGGHLSELPGDDIELPQRWIPDQPGRFLPGADTVDGRPVRGTSQVQPALQAAIRRTVVSR